MKDHYPIRHDNLVKEELSERFFKRCLPSNWIAHKPPNDYGIDLVVNLFEGRSASPLELLIQLKSSGTAADGDEETINLSTKTYNYLSDKLQVVMLVKYVIPEDEAYWKLLKDVPQPNQRQQSFTVHIPKSNKLSTIKWTIVEEHIEKVTNRKLEANRSAQKREKG